MAIATFVGIVITKDRRQFYVTPPVLALMAFMLWMCITLPFSFYLEHSLSFWDRVMKIDLMILVAIVVLYSRKHITILAWVLVGSLRFYGVKGGIFTIATGGSYRVWGPQDSYIEGNNEIALALVMIIPMMRFLQLTVENAWIKRGLTASMLLCATAAIGSYSRGALLALSAMAVVLWWRSQKKAGGFILLLAVGFVMLSFMPQEWWERMGTIRTYEDDASAGGRINAWWMAWNIAKDNLFGGGFSFVRGDICAMYAPIPNDCRAAHSIYFMVLGEHGFIGLFLFLLMWAAVWFAAGRLRVQGKKMPQTQWLSYLGAMSQVSLAGYAVGGAFLSLSYYDLPYNILLLVVLGCRWMDQKEWELEAQEEVRSLASSESKRAKFARR